MSKRIVVRLAIGIIGLLSGFLMIRIPAIPGIVSGLVASISAAWIAIVLATKAVQVSGMKWCCASNP